MKKSFFASDTTFSERVREVVKGIKKGGVLTYKQVASLGGSPNASRAVGTIMKNNYDPDIPCHRVVGSDGYVCDYNRGGKDAKINLLKKEGVMISPSGRVIL